MYPNNQSFMQGYPMYYGTNYWNNQNQQAPPAQQMIPVKTPKATLVASFDEVKSAPVSYDGCLDVFIDTQQDRIYTKQFTQDGKIDYKVFILTKDEPKEVNPESFASKADLEVLLGEIAELKATLNELKGGVSK